MCVLHSVSLVSDRRSREEEAPVSRALDRIFLVSAGTRWEVVDRVPWRRGIPDGEADAESGSICDVDSAEDPAILSPLARTSAGRRGADRIIPAAVFYADVEIWSRGAR